jgi:hypothetical protein
MEPFIQATAGINVEEIMAAIQKRIQGKKDAGLLKQSEIDEIVDMELQPLPDFQEIPNVYEPMLYPGFAKNTAPVTRPSHSPRPPRAPRLPRSPRSIRQPRPPRSPRPPRPEVPLPPLPVLEAVQESGLVKGMLKKIRTLLFPLIRFMSRPIYTELMTCIVDNQKMNLELENNLQALKNVTLEGLKDDVQDIREDLKGDLLDLRDDIFDFKADILDNVLDFKADILDNVEDFKTDMLDLNADLQKKVSIVLQSREYICLLHNALHNIIVEASKLKTEEEMLKTKIRILEDKIEFLENRQRALEKK